MVRRIRMLAIFHLLPCSAARREPNREKDSTKWSFDLKGPKLNVLICDKISFEGVAHFTRGSRSCSWARDRGRCIARSKSRFPPFPLRGPTITTLTTRDLCPGGSGVWACPKFVQPPPEVRGLNDGKISWDLKVPSVAKSSRNHGPLALVLSWCSHERSLENKWKKPPSPSPLPDQDPYPSNSNEGKKHQWYALWSWSRSEPILCGEWTHNVNKTNQNYHQKLYNVSCLSACVSERLVKRDQEKQQESNVMNWVYAT